MKTWQLIASAVAALAVLIAVGVMAWNFDPFGRRKNAETKAANAEAQSTTDKGTVQAVDHYTHETVVIRERADRAVQSVQQAPGASTVIDPDRRAVVCAALERVRNSPVCEADDQRPSDASSAVQGADKPSADPG